MFRMRSGFRALMVLCVCVVLLSFGGCDSGPKLAPTAVVTGQVTLDGKPLDHGSVEFIPDTQKGTTGALGVGMIDKNGNYRVTTAKRDGALVGWHLIRVVVLDETKPGLPWMIPFRYDRPEESGLAFEVKADTDNVYNIALTSNE